MNVKELSKLRFGTPVKLDAKDKKILEILQKEARLPISKIAKKAGMPADSVKYRIRRLEKEGVIRFYHAALNPSLLGYPMFTYTLFSLFAMDETTEKQFINFLVDHPKITWVSKNSGKWNFIIGTCTKDFKEYDEVLNQIRTRFDKHIKEFETTSTIEEYKWDMMYQLIQ